MLVVGHETLVVVTARSLASHPWLRASLWVCGVTPAHHAQLLSVPLVFWSVSELTLPMSHLMFLWTHRILSPSAVLHSFFRGSVTIFRRSTHLQVPLARCTLHAPCSAWVGCDGKIHYDRMVHCEFGDYSVARVHPPPRS